MNSSLSHSLQYFIPSSPSLSLESPHAWSYILHNKTNQHIICRHTVRLQVLQSNKQQLQSCHCIVPHDNLYTLLYCNITFQLTTLQISFFTSTSRTTCKRSAIMTVFFFTIVDSMNISWSIPHNRIFHRNYRNWLAIAAWKENPKRTFHQPAEFIR